MGIKLADILSKDIAELKHMQQGEMVTRKLGLVEFTQVDHAEHKQAKIDSTHMIPNPDKSGGAYVPDIDDDQLMIKLIVIAVDKDTRSDFTFANAELLKKLGVTTAEQAVQALVDPGEIYAMAVKIQNISGFGPERQKEIKAEVKNS